jgi:5,10-methylenetetrahydromethanopterin reductase
VKLSASLAPGPHVLEYARHAEELGYERIWLYDSPLLYWDCWTSLTQLAAGTSRIGIGVATLVPGLRHAITTVGAALAIDYLAPDRLALSVGTGFTGRRALGKRPHTWATVEAYATALRTLLRGEEFEIDGTIVRSLHSSAATRIGEARIPVLVAANGPKGIAVAHRVGDGIISFSTPIPGFTWSALAIQGTVLETGETLHASAVIDRIAAGIALQYHVAYELGGPTVVDQLPGGEKWRLEIEALPEERRHLTLHEGHVTEPPERERPFLHPDVGALTFTGKRAELTTRAAQFEQAGTTELIYTPLGADIHRELCAMADAVLSKKS